MSHGSYRELRSTWLRLKGRRLMAVTRILVIPPGSKHHKISKYKTSRNDQGSNLLNLLNPHATPLMLQLS
jgi:hypothetical protein